MKKALLTTLACLLIGGGLSAALAFDIPNIFSSGEQISSADVNENFQALADNATGVANALGTPISEDDLPLTITESGRYYLTEDVTWGSNLAGDLIFIDTSQAEHVIIDLNGHVLKADNGINISYGIRGDNVGGQGATNGTVTVLNGSMKNFQFGAISLATVDSSTIRDVEFTGNNSDVGVALSTSQNSTVENCAFLGDYYFSLQVGRASIIRGNKFRHSSQGFAILAGAVATLFKENTFNFSGPGGDNIFCPDCTLIDNAGSVTVN